MTNALAIVYSLPFAVGALAGVVGQRTYCWSKARYNDRYHPREDGTRHPVGGLSRIWVGGLVALLGLGYVLLTSQETHDDTVALAQRFGECGANFQQAQTERSNIATEDNGLANDQSTLRLELDDARQTWLFRLLNPPAEVARLDQTDLRRQAWNHDVTQVYYERTGKAVEKLKEIAQRRQDLADKRAATPLPPVKC